MSADDPEIGLLNSVTNQDFIEDYGPQSMIIVSNHTRTCSTTKVLSSKSNQRSLCDLQQKYQEDDIVRNKLHAKLSVATKSTQTQMENLSCYRCALVIKDVEASKEKSPNNAKTKRIIKSKSTSEIKDIFSNPDFTPTKEQMNQLQKFVQETDNPCKSPTLQNVTETTTEKASIHNKSKEDGNSYKEIFKEIFLILHNAHNA